MQQCRYKINIDLARCYRLKDAISVWRNNRYELFVWSINGDMFTSRTPKTINNTSCTLAKLGLQS